MAERKPDFGPRSVVTSPALPAAAANRAPDETAATAATPASAGSPGTCDFRLVCPNCGGTLYDRGCKSRCPRCHFFTDCSDPW